VGEKGHNQTLGKSGKRHPNGFPYPDGEWESPAGAALEPPRCQKIDHSRHNQRTGHALSVDTATEHVEEWGADRSFSDIEDD